MSDEPPAEESASYLERWLFRTLLATPLWFAFLVIFHGFELAHLWRAALISAVMAVLEPLGDDLHRRWRTRSTRG